jgi:hypothetical protein
MELSYLVSAIVITRRHDYTIKLGGQRYGFADYVIGSGSTTAHPVGPTRAHLGPLGSYRVPFSATTCWVLIVATPLVLVMLARVMRAGIRARPDNAGTILPATHE